MTILAVSAAARSAASSQVMPGVLGFLVVAALSIALFFLLRSMNRQLRKVVPPRPPGTRGHGRGGQPAAGSRAKP